MLENIQHANPAGSVNYQRGQIPGVELSTPETQKDRGPLQAESQGEARHENSVPFLQERSLQSPSKERPRLQHYVSLS